MIGDLTSPYQVGGSAGDYHVQLSIVVEIGQHSMPKGCCTPSTSRSGPGKLPFAVAKIEDDFIVIGRVHNDIKFAVVIEVAQKKTDGLAIAVNFGGGAG